MYQVSQAIYIGPFLSPARVESLRRAQITHVLNVSEAASIIVADGVPAREVAWHPVLDLMPLSMEIAITCLNTLHRMVCEPAAKVYVHCIAGQNRSPTIVWLYLIACGVSPDEARELIERGSPDAIPGHSALVSPGLIAAVQAHGQQHFMPHPCRMALASIVATD